MSRSFFSNSILIQFGFNNVYPVNDLHNVSFSITFILPRPNVFLSISNFGGEFYSSSIVLQTTTTGFIPQTDASTYRSLYWVAIGY